MTGDRELVAYAVSRHATAAAFIDARHWPSAAFAPAGPIDARDARGLLELVADAWDLDVFWDRSEAAREASMRHERVLAISEQDVATFMGWETRRRTPAPRRLRPNAAVPAKDPGGESEFDAELERRLVEDGYVAPTPLAELDQAPGAGVSGREGRSGPGEARRGVADSEDAASGFKEYQLVMEGVPLWALDSALAALREGAVEATGGRLSALRPVELTVSVSLVGLEDTNGRQLEQTLRSYLRSRALPAELTIV